MGGQDMFCMAVDDDLVLAVIEERHSQALYTLVEEGRETLRPWLPWVDKVQNLDDYQAWVRNSLNEFATGEGVHAALWFRGEAVGVISLHSIVWWNQSATVGYWLAPPYWGKGLMTRACIKIVDSAFSDRGLNRIEIPCAVNNVKSRAIPERLGFFNEGELREAGWADGQYVNLVLYSMLAKDWGIRVE